MIIRNRVVVVFLLFLAVTGSLIAAEDITGIWKSINEEGQTTSVTCIYRYQGKVYGRLLVTYDEGILKDLINQPIARAENFVGDPYYAGFDFIWNLEDMGKKWGRGKIADPKEGKIYDSVLWKKGSDLIVRGKIGPFGRNQTWVAVPETELPAGLDYGNPAAWIPIIPELKK